MAVWWTEARHERVVVDACCAACPGLSLLAVSIGMHSTAEPDHAVWDYGSMLFSAWVTASGVDGLG
jgi:hypothetical protein